MDVNFPFLKHDMNPEMSYKLANLLSETVYDTYL